MTTINLRIGKPIDWNEDDGYTYATVTDWCEDCYLDRDMYKCRAAFSRPEGIYIDDVFKYYRPAECFLLQVEP